MKNKTTNSINPWSIFLVTALGVWMATIDTGIVNVALPTLTHQFNVSIGHIQWVVSGYLLVICATLPLSGRLADIYTRRVLYLSGMFIFFISSALCGMAWSFWSLVLFRFIQGLGAAMLMANNLALIITAFPKGKQGRAVGINSMLVAIGLIAGPGLGGLLISLAGWRLIFYINVPIGILGCLIGYYILPKDTANTSDHIDFTGAFIFALGMCCFILALTYKIITLIPLVILLLIIFIKWEKHSKNPMINLELFKISAYTFGTTITFITYLAFAVNSILLPFYLQDLRNSDPATIGLFLLLPPIFLMLTAPISGYLADRYNQVILTTTGLCAIFIALLIQSFLNINTPLWKLCFTQSLLGLGVGFFTSPNNYRMLKNVPKSHISVGSSIASLMRNSGRITGIAVSISIFTLIQKHIALHANYITAFIAGFKYAFLTSAAFIMLAIILSINSLSHRKPKS